MNFLTVGDVINFNKHTMTKTIQDRIIEQFRDKYVIENSLGFKVVGEKFRYGEIFLRPEQLEQFLIQSIKEVQEETRKEIGNELIEFIIRENNEEGMSPNVEEYFNEFYKLFLTNKENK